MSEIRVDEGSVKEGLLGLVLALVEIIADVLRAQALRRMESGSLDGAEVEALGRAMMELDRAVADVKSELGLAAAVESVRRSLDETVERLLAHPVPHLFQGGDG